jgi:hypothetical protein
MQEQKTEIQIEEVCLNMERTLSILPGGGDRDRGRREKCKAAVLGGAGTGLLMSGRAGWQAGLLGAAFGGVSSYLNSPHCGRPSKSSNRRSER